MDFRSLQHYRHLDQTKADINRIKSQYRSLDPKIETFVFTDGRRAELVNLQGTIPVVYKNSLYNIPICIWLMETHPDNAPMCFLKPTPNMKINISHHVDHAGKIYAPYLHDWTPGRSDLLTLIQVLIMLFSEKPPLYSVTSPTSNAAPAPQSTPYPVQPTPYYMPVPSTANASPYPYGGTPTPPGQRPPYPIPTNNAVQPPYPTQPNITPYLPYPTGPTKPQPGGIPSSTGTVTEEHIHASLLSAVEDKVRRTIRDQIGQWQAELESLERIQTELAAGKERLHHLTSKLESEQAEWEKVLSTLRDKETELDSALSQINKQGEMDVDEAVVTTAPLYKQLLNAFAEEAATEDAIYYLGEGLRRGVIDLDVFLKHVRSLSRKQFMLRALMHKCRNKAGLAC